MKNFGIAFLFLTSIFSYDKSFAQVLDSALANDFSVCIRHIVIEGNVKTKPQVILRELLFAENDSIQFKNLNQNLSESKLNIINTGLFYSVVFNLKNWEGKNIDLYITVEEKWYTYPIPTIDIFDRNFNSWYVEHNHDWKRLQYGIRFLQQNLRGRDENLRVNILFGFVQKFEAAYEIPFIDRKQSFGLQVKVSYIRSKIVAFETRNNIEQFYFDADDFVRKSLVIQSDFTLKPGFHDKNIFTAGYVHSTVEDTIPKLNPDFFLNEKKDQQYFALGYSFIRDNRDIKGFPLHGSYFEANILKMGILPDDNINMFSIQATYSKYFSLGKNFYLSIRNKLKFSLPEKQPYFTQKGFGYKTDYVSGYEYYVVDGQSFWLGKLNLRYRLFKIELNNSEVHSPLRASKLPFALYIKTQVDAGYVKDDFYFQNNSLNNSLLIGGGPAIDIVIFYDINFSFEYSINRLGESGLFLHLSTFF